MKNKGTIIWGLYVLIGGILLLLKNLDVVKADVFAILWPIAIILVGLSCLAPAWFACCCCVDITGKKSKKKK